MNIVRLVMQATTINFITLLWEIRMETVGVQMCVIWGFAILMVLLERNKSKG